MLPQKKYKLIIVPIVFTSALLWYQNPHQQKLEYLRFDTLLETNQNGISEIMPRPHSFFLVETSGRIKLTSKELCVLESVAKYHPTNQVYLLLTSPIFEDENFEIGSRMCLGQRLALMEMKIFMAKFLQTFQLVPTARTKLEVESGGLFMLSYPEIIVKLEQRT